MKLTPEKTAVATILLISALTIILSGATRISIRLAASENATDAVEARLSEVESTVSDLADTSEDQNTRLDDLETQQQRRSW